MTTYIGDLDSSGTLVTITNGATLPSYFRTDGTAQVFGYVGTTLITVEGVALSAIGTDGNGRQTWRLATGHNPNTTNVQFTVAQPFVGAQNAIYQNCASISATPGTLPLSGTLSASAGYGGSDGGSSIDLGAAFTGAQKCVAWFWGDVFWATAAGQTRGQSTTIRGPMALQTGGTYWLNYTTSGTASVGSDNLTFYTGGTNTAPKQFVQATWPSTTTWPFYGGGCLGQYSLIFAGPQVQNVLSSGETVNSDAFYWVNNINTAGSVTPPTQWVIQTIPGPGGEAMGGISTPPWVTLATPVNAANPSGPTRTDVYWLGHGYDSQTNVTYHNGNSQPLFYRGYVAGRTPVSDLNVAAASITPSFARTEYWCGPSGWVQNPDANMVVPVIPWGLNKPEGVYANHYGLDTTFGLYQKSDGTFVVAIVIDFADGRLGYTNMASISNPSTVTSFNEFYYIPTSFSNNGSDLYNLFVHPEQTWPGKATDDICVHYNIFDNSGFTSAATYWPQFVQVTGI